MADTVFTWNVAQMERHTADGIVFTVHYTVDANDGTYSAGAYGSVGLEQPEGNVIPRRPHRRGCDRLGEGKARRRRKGC